MARDFDRQVAEFQIRVAVLNGFTAIGIPVTEAMGQVCPGKGEDRPSPICATEPWRCLTTTALTWPALLPQ